MEFTSLFPGSLTLEDRGIISNQLALQRLQQFRHLLSISRLPEASGKQKIGLLQHYIAAISRLSSDDPNGCIAYLNRWPTTFYISRFLHHGLDANVAAARLLPGLLFETLKDGSSPLEDAIFATPIEDGAVAVPAKNLRISIPAMPKCQQVRWECSKGDVSVVTDDGKIAVREKLPLNTTQTNKRSGLSFECYEVSAKWHLPIIDKGMGLLHIAHERVHGNSNEVAHPEQGQIFSLADSLDDCYDILARTWPTINDWVDVLVPAFFDLTSDYNSNTRQSGSFGPGAPVYLTRVANAYLHAEDVVHELQHQRFQLAVPADQWFERWKDSRQIFTSPYRRDPRPLFGLHLGIHAFVSVNEFRIRRHKYEAMSSWDVREFAKTQFQNEFVLRTVAEMESIRPQGRSFYREILETIERHSIFLNALNVPDVVRDSLHSLRNHRTALGETENSGLAFEAMTGEDFRRVRTVFQ